MKPGVDPHAAGSSVVQMYRLALYRALISPHYSRWLALLTQSVAC